MPPRRSEHPHGKLLQIWSHHVAADTAPQLRRVLVHTAHPSGVTTVVLDLSEIGLFAAAGFEALHAARVELSGSLAVHVVATGSVLESMHLAGLPDTLTVHPDHDAALAATETGEVESLREQLAQCERQLASQPVTEQAKGMIMQDFGVATVVDALNGQVSAETAAKTRETLKALRDG